MSNKFILNWAPMSHCPEDQLCKPGDPSDAGFDIRVAKDIEVPTYRDLDEAGKYEVEIVKRCEVWESGRSLRPVLGNFEDVKMLLAHARRRFYTFKNTCYVGEYEAGINLGSIERFKVRKKYKLPLVGTGIKVAPESLAWCGVIGRSGLSKYGVRLGNVLGVIDFSYAGEILLALVSDHEPVFFAAGERVAQLIVMPQYNVELVQRTEEELDEGRNLARTGFNSTGIS